MPQDTTSQENNNTASSPAYVPPPSPIPPLGPQASIVNGDAFIKRYQTEVAASASSCLSTFIAFPLDSVKTRMQAYKFRSFADCIQQTYQTEGMGGFWRGSLAPLASVTLVRTVSFSIYTNSKGFYGELLQKVFGPNAVTAHRAEDSGSLPKPGDALRWAMSGATAGAAITAIACPFEFTKLSAQIEYLMSRSRVVSLDEPSTERIKYEAKGTAQAAQYIIRTRGLRGLYSGFHLHFARDTLGTAIYFTIYESAKQVLSSTGSEAGPLAIAAAGGLCGLLSWVMIYPVDSLKSIYQRDILTHKPGTPLPKRPLRFSRRMYRGLGVSMTRSAILNAVFFSSYEFIKRRVGTA
ncbi:mitochondrial carrier [Terfezia boudieri ATCC MYA-4762]|uniref:Mitochondrial carrier n=1 Tax=Terfezia boudieri ATCC MYA-4762 TaxID=1051890 RepID=A0A3N4LY70_9PEZI|nr:mitochondrial carrier [Terfezia boudieri ATCC MYA-4762]